MINDSMKSNKIIGMIQPQSSSYQKVQPELHKVGCIGKITSFRETEDLIQSIKIMLYFNRIYFQ